MKHLGLMPARSTQCQPALPAEPLSLPVACHQTAGTLSPGDVSALLAAFPGAIDHIERDADFVITGDPQPEWLHSDAVPEAARQGRRRHLMADARRAQQKAAAARRRQLPEQQQGNPSWNLDRIDQQALPLDRLYHYDATGTGVNV